MLAIHPQHQQNHTLNHQTKLQGTHRLLLSSGRGADDSTTTPLSSSNGMGDANSGIRDVRREMDMSFLPRAYTYMYICIYISWLCMCVNLWRLS